MGLQLSNGRRINFNNEADDGITGNDLMGHVLALVVFFKGKMQEGNLSASEGAVYLKCLGLLGVSDEISKNRNVGRLADTLGGLELPFPEVGNNS